MGFNFSLIPGGSGATGEIVTGLDLAISAIECAGTEGVNVPACVRAIVDLFELAFDLFFNDLFAGRPKVGKDSASDDTALFFIPSPNPVIRMWGMGIRALEAQGYPTSASGGIGLQQSVALANAVLADLRRQFDAAPLQHLVNQFGTFPVNGLNMFSWYHHLGFQTPNPDSNSPVIAERVILDQFYNNLVINKYIDPNTGFPHQTPTPPPPPPPPPINPAQIPPPPHSAPTNPTDEELCCWYEEQYAYHSAVAVDQIRQAIQHQSTDQTCCNKVTTSLTSIHTGLGQIVAAIAAGARELNHPINLAPIETGLHNLLTELHADNAAAHTTAAQLLAAVTRIAVAEEKEKTVDLSAIVEQLHKIEVEGDVPKELITELIKQGYIEEQYSGMLQGSPWSSVLSVIHALTHSRWFQKFAAAQMVAAKDDPLLGPAYSKHVLGVGKDATDIKSLTSSDLINFTTDTTTAIFTKVFGLSGKVFGPVVEGVLKAHEQQIAKLRNVQPCGENAVAGELLTEAIGAAVAAHFASVAVEAAYPSKNLGFEKIADLIAAIAGIEDIIKGIIGVEINQLVTIPHRYCINEQGRTILPGMGPAGALHARGLLPEATARRLLAYNGLNAQYENATLAAAYSGLNPRMMMRLVETGLFSDTDVADELTFSGLRPTSQHRMLHAAPYLATDPERKQLRSTLEKAYVDGFLDDANLVQQIDDAEHNYSRDFLILDRVRLEKRMSIAKELEAEYTTMYLGNLINLDTYHAYLAGLGLQDDRVRALTARNEAKAAVTLARQEAAAARALAKATTAIERKAAIRNYLEGNINAPALGLALVATGLTNAQTAAWVDMAVLQAAGLPRFKFGLKLSADQAQLLTDRVRALEDQRKRQLITDLQFRDALHALHIPANYINALRAAADATLTPAKSALALPVETSP